MKYQSSKMNIGDQELCEVVFKSEVGIQPSQGRHTLTFSASQLFVVPEGVSELRIFAFGAAGGAGNGFGVLLNNSGDGGIAVSNVAVTAGESLEIFIGSSGQNGSMPDGGQGGSSTVGFEGGTASSGKAGGGGGGGGASGVIRVRGDEILVVAGGGGGGSGVGNGGRIGRGGAGGSFGTNNRGLSPTKVRSVSDTRGCNGAADSKVGIGGGGGGYYGGYAGCDYHPQIDDEKAEPINTLDMGLISEIDKQTEGLVLVSYDLPQD